MIQGIVETGKVFIDGKELSPERSQKIYIHSLDGFSWGYLGSSPAQLALAILLELVEEKVAIKIYRKFMNVIANLNRNEDFLIPKKDISLWIVENFPTEWLEKERKLDKEFDNFGN